MNIANIYHRGVATSVGGRAQGSLGLVAGLGTLVAVLQGYADNGEDTVLDFVNHYCSYSPFVLIFQLPIIWVIDVMCHYLLTFPTPIPSSCYDCMNDESKLYF